MQLRNLLHLFEEQCLRVFLTVRLSFRLACFVDNIFSGSAYFKHTAQEVLQSSPKILEEKAAGRTQGKIEIYIEYD